jgi:hypothetical protein
MEVQDFITNKVFISGNRFLRFFYKISLKYYKRKLVVITKKVSKLDQKILRASDKNFVINDINFYSPRLLIVKYKETFSDIDYEITLQDPTNWVEFYKESLEIKEIPSKLRHLINMELVEQYRNAIVVVNE